MNRILIFVLPLLIFGAFSQPLYSQEDDEEWLKKEFEITKQLIVMIIAESDGAQEFGAGIIVGHKKDELLIATAYHFLHKGEVQADKIQVQFRIKPGTYTEATLLKSSHEATMDLALLSVKELSKQGINVCPIPFNRLGNIYVLERGDGVYPIGNPNGTPWAMPVFPDRVAELSGNDISFQSSFISKGNSGGALLNESAEIIGLVISDQPPFGRAINMESVISKIKQWSYPVQLYIKEESGLDSLHMAIIDKNLIEVKKLIAGCSDVNQKDYYDQTPLHFAAGNENPEFVRILVDAGADVNAITTNKFDPLEIAIRTGKVENVKLLAEAGANLNEKLVLTILNRDLYGLDETEILKIIKILVSAGSDVNTMDIFGNTPLTHVLLHLDVYSLETIKFLVSVGADVNPSGAGVDTMVPPKNLLDLALESGNKDVFKFLLSQGAKANEEQMNIYAYQLLEENKFHDAIKAFIINVKNYPDSWNVYDSLGEAYDKSGNTKEAISNYKIALSKAPQDQKVRIQEILKKLGANG